MFVFSGEDAFFRSFIHYLSLPLTAKDRTPFVDRCLEMACRFAASFIKKPEENPDQSQQQPGEENEIPEEEDLPPFMHKLIKWLLDHHQVIKLEEYYVKPNHF